MRRGDGRWLMQQRPAHRHHGSLWEFPGGKVEPDETPVKALARELAEEIGIECVVKDLEPFSFAEIDAEGRHPGTVILLYKLSRWRGEPVALEVGAQLGWWLPAEIEVLQRPPLDIRLCRKLLGSDHIGNAEG